MAVRAVDVDVLELRCGRQNKIGVIHRVGREQFVDHHEQVIAAQALQNLGLVGGNRGRIAVVDVKCPNGRPGSSPARASPSSFMFTVRVLGGARSGRVSLSMAKSYVPLVDRAPRRPGSATSR